MITKEDYQTIWRIMDKLSATLPQTDEGKADFYKAYDGAVAMGAVINKYKGQ